MPENLPADSVGIVRPRVQSFDSPLELVCGRTLPRFELRYETYGELNDARTNALLVCHALSGHHHAAGYHSLEDRKPGWWDVCIGPGKAIDTNRFFVVCPNNLGGCHGSTGPTSPNPETGRIYGPDFPSITVRDWVTTQAMLADALDIPSWAVVIGGSLGGMQAMQWAIDFPERIKHAVMIAAAPRLSAQNIAFNEIARQAILSDPDFHGGRYLEKGTNPAQGLMLARMLGHVTYQSDDGLRDKFGREVKSGDLSLGLDVEFQVESYLHYQGRSFSESFDANTYLLITHALDYFDPARENGDDLAEALSVAKCKFFAASFTTDWRFSTARTQEIVDALVLASKDVASVVIDCPHGHDAFLLPVPRYIEALGTYLAHVADHP